MGFTLTCIKTAVRLLACCTALSASIAFADALDADVIAAKEASRTGNVRALEAAKAKLAGHLLEAYPTYWLLNAPLERADPAQVQTFLARHADSPLADALRRDWLKQLGATGSWDAFRAEYPRLVGEDIDITCYAYRARLAAGDAEVFTEARSLFLAGREASASCDPVFAALADGKHIGPPEVFERLRKLLAANAMRDAKRTNALLPAGQQFNDKTLDRAGSDPAKFLAHEKSPIFNRATKELVIYAVARLARSKPEEAADRLVAVAGRLGPDELRYAWGQLAFQAAMIHHPRALAWYAEAGDAPLTDAQLAWKARAALRAGEWKTVLAAIQALSPEEARDGAWRYWRARALRELGSPEAAQALLTTLVREPNFYGLLAADQLGLSAAPAWEGYKPTEADLARVRAMPGIQRALTLYRLDLDTEAFREWFFAVRSLSDPDLLAAAELARQAGEPDRAINAADRTVAVHDFGQRYPVPHRDALAAASKVNGVDEAWMYGIIRQESRFVSEARSRVGATGLMQLMPSTARWVARQMSMPSFTPAMLSKPEVNVQMGTYYFKRVMGDLGGDPVLATAAYNAGPGRAKRWRDAKPLEGAIYAETIPFPETRDYVKKVLANTWFYTSRLTGKTTSMVNLAGTVPGRGATDAADAALAAAVP
ncbi:lytic transglycosylase domain-containing protein [Usitatibacter rugosus]|uniref:lytic transglycosylase domain-containing protein n=1 Tax=Usitatibacter rugosus TaxID=2732067 RepID=UPI001BB2894E|nr:lytic transglycosylase domain-containing protein [Usitatibacter rugosus]